MADAARWNVRFWRLLSVASLLALIGSLAALTALVVAFLFARDALAFALFRTFLEPIPASRLGREIGYVVLNVVGVPGLNTSGRPGDDPYLVLDAYPPITVALAVAASVLLPGSVYLLARRRGGGATHPGGRPRRRKWAWAVAGTVAALGVAIGAARLWARSFEFGLEANSHEISAAVHRQMGDTRRAAHHSRVAAQYRYAERHPWLSVSLDPSE